MCIRDRLIRCGTFPLAYHNERGLHLFMCIWMSSQAGGRKKQQVVLSVTCWHSPKEETSLRVVDVYASCSGQSVFPSSHSWRRQNQKMRADLRKLLTFLDCVVKVKKSWWFLTSTCCTNFSLAFYLQKTYPPIPTPRFHFTSLCFLWNNPISWSSELWFM